jgi:hypothetical protein
MLAASSPAASTAAKPPTPADFVNLPTCMVYAEGSDLRLRVHAAHAATVCKALPVELRGLNVRWTLRPQRIRHILTPVCLIAAPTSRLELQVTDQARNPERGASLCGELVRSGWLNLGR